MELKITGLNERPEWLNHRRIEFSLNDIPEYNKIFIEGDSSEYDILWDAAKMIKDVEGIVLEIGVRLGMSSFVIMNSCLENQDTEKRFFGVDCYGSWPGNGDFSNNMKMQSKRNLMTFACISNLDYTLLELEDTEFIERYADGIPLYNRTVFDTKQYKPEDYEWKNVCNQYSLVHLDGPHRMQDVVLESDFFLPRIAKGGVIIYDDINKPKKYNHDEFEPTIFEHGFELINKRGSKASYKKV